MKYFTALRRTVAKFMPRTQAINIKAPSLQPNANTTNPSPSGSGSSGSTAPSGSGPGGSPG